MDNTLSYFPILGVVNKCYYKCSMPGHSNSMGKYTDEMKSAWELDLQPYIYSNTSHDSADMETTQIPVERDIDEEIVVYLLHELLLSH